MSKHNIKVDKATKYIGVVPRSEALRAFSSVSGLRPLGAVFEKLIWIQKQIVFDGTQITHNGWPFNRLTFVLINLWLFYDVEQIVRW